YGHFADDGSSYIVTSVNTPRPWTNLLSNHRMASFFSQTGQGFLYYISHNLEQITNWQEAEYTPGTMSRGRLVFIKDRETTKYWTGNPQPGETGFSNFSCTVEPGVSTIHAIRNGIDFTMRAFVPWDADVEIWTITLNNRGKKTRKLSVLPSIEFPARQGLYFFNGVFMEDTRAIEVTSTNYDYPTKAFFACDAKVTGYDAHWKKFYGPANDRLNPDGIRNGLSNSSTANDYTVGVLETRITLRAGESRSFNVFVGRAMDRGSIRKLLKRFRKDGGVDKALAGQRAHWERHEERVHVEIPDHNMECALNKWSPYCVDISSRFRQGSKIGYRDMLQYMRAYVTLDPNTCREALLKILGYQYKCGKSIRGYKHNGELDKRDARDGVSWIADTLCAYIKESGDKAILDTVVPYMDKGRGTVWEHALLAVEFLYKNRGKHRMCYVGGGDWNDALNLAGKHGRGESVWLSIATCRALRFTADIADYIGDKKTAKKLREWRKNLVRDINKYAWDGNWYIYGFTDDGTAVGTCKEDGGGRIYANAQTWALMEKIVPSARISKVWKSIDRYLYTDIGVLVLHPVYRKRDDSIGRITAMPCGANEHGSAYAHGTAFMIGALTENKLGSEAVECWHRVHPTNPKNPNSGCEPYSCTSHYIGPSSQRFGESRSSWFTGSVAWIYFQGIEGILGIKPDFNGLRIDPAVPAKWKRYKVKRMFRGTFYDITIRNPAGNGSGVKQIKVDGKKIRGNLIPLPAEGSKSIKVDVLL
ncbi:MAG: hypothetical protein KAH23_09360, partial [Kiritimatiellae bacterium]|nr:hypothetical protein [Kiritimatiellia bacterium]